MDVKSRKIIAFYVGDRSQKNANNKEIPIIIRAKVTSGSTSKQYDLYYMKSMLFRFLYGQIEN